MSILAPKAREKGLFFAHSVQQDLPDYFSADATRLRQILLNLVGNAVKFTSVGYVRVDVAGWSADAGGEGDARFWHLSFQVTDSGIGIPKESLGKLFQTFSQVDSGITRKYGGSGLGLSICKRLADLMGGSIKVESEPGVGSVFTFAVSLREAHRAPVQPAVLPDKGSTPSGSSSPGLRILLAEDNAVNVKVAVAMLKRLRYSCSVAGNGQEAVEAVQSAAKSGEPFHIVLMDMQMPVMGGLEATVKIRALPGIPQPRIIALTANAMESDKQKCLDAGMNDYMSKPMRMEVLRSALELSAAAATYPVRNDELSSHEDSSHEDSGREDSSHGVLGGGKGGQLGPDGGVAT